MIRLVVMMYVRFPLSLRNVEDLLFERGIDICHETVRLWWNRFGPMFAGDIRRQRVSRMRGFRHWRWHLDEMYVKLGDEVVYLWRAFEHEGARGHPRRLSPAWPCVQTVDRMPGGASSMAAVAAAILSPPAADGSMGLA